MPPNETTTTEARRRRAWIRSLGIASAAAFAGGVAVVGVQYTVGLVSAGYPPVVQALICGTEDDDGTGTIALVAEGGTMIPVADVAAGRTLVCRIDAPSADYATWNVIGPVAGSRSGPLDTTLPCQSPEDFADQDPASLRLSACQRMTTGRPGLHLLSVTVMLRGQTAADRARMVIRVVAPPQPAPATELHREPIAMALRLPAMTTEETRDADLTASFGEHGLLPQSRGFEQVVYRLASGETFVGAVFRARSAANASAVRLAYVPESGAVTARFTLRSGSLVDRWRGWVSGTAVVTVRLQQPARDIALPGTDLVVPGRTEVPLPEGLDLAHARVLLRQPRMAAPVEIQPGEAAALDGTRVVATVVDRMLVLEATSD